MKMKTKNKVIAVLSIFSISLVSYFVVNSKTVVKTDAKSEKLNISLKNLPPEVVSAALNEDFDLKNYSRSIKDLRIARDTHVQIAEKLYSVAFTTANYSSSKLRLLQQAKEHLLLAKEIQGTL